MKKHVYTLELPIRWGDMDAIGHVNNCVYFRYFEQARVQWWQSLGRSLDEMSQGPILITASCTFLQAIKYPETLRIEVLVGPPGRSSYVIYYELYSKASGDKVAAGETKVVWLDYIKNQSIPLPEDMLAHLPTNT